MAEQHKLFLSSKCRKKRSSWHWECDNDPELELYLTPLLLRVPPDVTPPAAAGTGPGLAPAEEEFKGEMSSLAVRACDKRFQALHGHGRLVGARVNCMAVSRSRDSPSLLSHPWTTRGWMPVVFRVVARQLPTHLIANAVPRALLDL